MTLTLWICKLLLDLFLWRWYLTTSDFDWAWIFIAIVTSDLFFIGTFLLKPSRK